MVRELLVNKAHTPKAVGMLIDLGTFEDTDILEFITNPKELKERVKEAENLEDQKLDPNSSEIPMLTDGHTSP